MENSKNQLKKSALIRTVIKEQVKGFTLLEQMPILEIIQSHSLYAKSVFRHSSVGGPAETITNHWDQYRN
jgi:hypothetical protein